MKLYGSDLSPFVQRVKMQIAAKGLEVEYLPPPGGGLKSEEFLAINPIGKIPCLVTDSGIGWPSMVACRNALPLETNDTSEVAPAGPSIRRTTSLPGTSRTTS